MVGLLLIISGLFEKGNTDSKVKQAITGIINTFLLWIAIYGASSGPQVMAEMNVGGRASPAVQRDRRQYFRGYD